MVVQQLSADKKLTLLYATYTCAFFCFPFVICSLVVSGTANAGFNAVLTAILNMCFIAESYYILKNSKTPIAVSIHSNFLLDQALFRHVNLLSV